MRRVLRMVAAIMFLSQLFALTTVANPTEAVNSSQAKMKKEAVFELSRKVAEDNGYKLTEYESPKFSFVPKSHEWRVLYNHKSPAAPGAHFSVVVSDMSSTARLVPGK